MFVFLVLHYNDSYFNVNFNSSYRPEVKENKEGADTEKAAEQSAEPEELVKEKVRGLLMSATCFSNKIIF